MLWSVLENDHPKGLLAAIEGFRAQVTNEFRINYSSVTQSLAKRKGFTASEVDAMGFAEFQAWMGRHEADAIVLLEVEHRHDLDSTAIDSRYFSKLNVRSAVFTADDGRLGDLAPRRFGPEGPVLDPLRDLEKSLAGDAQSLTNPALDLLDGWYRTTRKDGRVVELVIGSTKRGEPTHRDIRDILEAIPGCTKPDLKTATRPIEELIVISGLTIFTKQERPRHWRRFKLRCRGSLGDFAERLESGFSVPKFTQDTLPKVELIGNLVALDLMP